MSTIDNMPLLDAMDVLTDLRLLYDPKYSQADDQLVFRDLQKKHLPGLDREQFQTLFAEWRDRYAAKCALDWIKARDRILRHAEEQCRRIPPSPFKCVCGEQTKDPLDPAWMPSISRIARGQARSASRANSVSGARGRRGDTVRRVLSR